MNTLKFKGYRVLETSGGFQVVKDMSDECLTYGQALDKMFELIENMEV